MRWIIVLAFVVAGFAFSQPALSFPKVPDEEQTPGSLCAEDNPDFTEYRYHEQIAYCTRNVSTGLKTRIYQAYDIPLRCKNLYTIDHFIPLSIGGTNEQDNLWPEHRELKHLRQNLEMEVYSKLRAGAITQDQAVTRIVHEKMNPPLDDLAPGDPCATSFAQVLYQQRAQRTH